MRFFLVDIISHNLNSLWIEEHNIPYQSKSKFRTRSVIYKNCLFDKNTYNDYLNKPDYLIDRNLFEERVKAPLYTIYSDGGSFNNGKKNKDLPVFGSLAYVITKNGKEIYRNSEGRENTTNNIMELSGGLLGLEWIKNNITTDNDQPIHIVLSSDSQYLMKGISEWILGWKKRNWKNNTGEEIKNFEIWKSIDKFLSDSKYRIFTNWVKGHQDIDDDSDNIIKFNNECDLLCNKEINTLLESYNLPTRKIGR